MIEKYRKYAVRFTREELQELKGKTLACWCKPQACHADVLAELAESEEES